MTEIELSSKIQRVSLELNIFFLSSIIRLRFLLKFVRIFNCICNAIIQNDNILIYLKQIHIYFHSFKSHVRQENKRYFNFEFGHVTMRLRILRTWLLYSSKPSSYAVMPFFSLKAWCPAFRNDALTLLFVLHPIKNITLHIC